jgi:hypothetical protein
MGKAALLGMAACVFGAGMMLLLGGLLGESAEVVSLVIIGVGLMVGSHLLGPRKPRMTQAGSVGRGAVEASGTRAA